MVVNAFGNVVDPATNVTLAGCRENSRSRKLIDVELEIRRLRTLGAFPDGKHTVVGAVVTNAVLNKTQLTKVAQMAHDGLARSIYPSHTLYDGDTIFALSCGSLDPVEVTIVGALAAQATAQAVVRAVRKAHSLDSIPAFRDL
jgi:L-aminopeptidase/D-esterase-like protein